MLQKNHQVHGWFEICQKHRKWIQVCQCIISMEKNPYEMTVLENFIFLSKVGEPAAIDA